MTSKSIALGLLALLLQGCASVAVDRGKDVSAAAIAYADATVAVIDVAIDAAIDADSDAQAVIAPKRPVAETDLAQRAVDLEQLDAGLAAAVLRYTALKTSIRSTRAYFVALQALADGSPADADAIAVQAAAKRVDSLSAALAGANGTPPLSATQVKAIGGLTRAVVTQVHGAVLEAALTRDAPVIGRALQLQQAVLALAGDDIRAHLAEAGDRFYALHVRGPYQRGALGSPWPADRRIYLKVRALNIDDAALGAAAAAAERMQVVWAGILAGTYSARDVAATLQGVQDLLDAVQALKLADSPK